MSETLYDFYKRKEDYVDLTCGREFHSGLPAIGEASMAQ